MSLWADEHGTAFEVPVEVSQLEGVRDLSWHNDTCPRFAVTEDGQGPNLWVDHPDPDERELGGSRFYVVHQAHDCASSDDVQIHEGDDLAAAVAAFVTAVVNWRRPRF